MKDIPTITELSVLALYEQAITCPYMHQIFEPGAKEMNMLDQSPLHDILKEHLQKIIDNPDLLLGSDATYESGALNGSGPKQ